MPTLIDDIVWEQPTVPRCARDPVFAARLRKHFGGSEPPVFDYIAGSPWLREAYVGGMLEPVDVLPRRAVDIAKLVSAQENTCRYCYGVARTQMRLLGYDPALIDRIERDFQMAEREDAEVIRFCRILAKSNPRPARREADALSAIGYSDLQIAELAFLVATSTFLNRVSTLVAAPPASSLEELPDKPWAFLIRPFIAWSMRRRPTFPDWPPLDPSAPYADVLRPLEGSIGARYLGDALTTCFADDTLPRRTKAWLFAVVARAMRCGPCEGISRGILDAEGVPEDACALTLERLGSDVLDDTERVLVPWVRDTVRVREPAPLQRQTREMAETIGVDLAIQAIGVSGLANTMVRLAMLTA